MGCQLREVVHLVVGDASVELALGAVVDVALVDFVFYCHSVVCVFMGLYVVLGGGAVRLVLVVQLHSLELHVASVVVAVLQVHRSRGDDLDVGSQDVLGGSEVLCGLGSLGADAGLEDGEVGELHGVAVETDLSDASHHVVQQTDDLALRVRAVVSAHVFGDAFEVDDVGVDGAGVELALGVVVRLALVNCVLNHVFSCVFIG